MSRILVVEDEVDISQPIAMFLSDRGHDVRTARNGSEAIEIGRTFGPDVLLCDWLLHGETDGLTVARDLFADNPELVIVFVTGLPVESIAARIKGLPVRQVLSKPTSLVHIGEAMKEITGT